MVDTVSDCAAGKTGRKFKESVVEAFDRFHWQPAQGVHGEEQLSPADVVEWVCYLDSQG